MNCKTARAFEHSWFMKTLNNSCTSYRTKCGCQGHLDSSSRIDRQRASPRRILWDVNRTDFVGNCWQGRLPFSLVVGSPLVHMTMFWSTSTKFGARSLKTNRAKQPRQSAKLTQAAKESISYLSQAFCIFTLRGSSSIGVCTDHVTMQD